MFEKLAEKLKKQHKGKKPGWFNTKGQHGASLLGGALGMGAEALGLPFGTLLGTGIGHSLYKDQKTPRLWGKKDPAPKKHHDKHHKKHASTVLRTAVHHAVDLAIKTAGDTHKKNTHYGRGTNSALSMAAGGISPFLSSLPSGALGALPISALAGALSSPENYRGEGIAGQLWGTAAGGALGSIPGAVLGGLGGKGLAHLLNKNEKKYTTGGAVAGGLLGAAGGGAYGANALRKAMLRESGAFGPEGAGHPTKELGLRDLLATAGSTTPLSAPIYGALTSPSGYRGTGALGALGGSIAGGLGGGALGAGAGNLIARSLGGREKSRNAATLIGGGAGGVLGSMAGGGIGRHYALKHEGAKNASLKDTITTIVKTSAAHTETLKG